MTHFYVIWYFSVRPFLKLFFAALFGTAGVLHLILPNVFLSIMPPWIPSHRACVIVSGVAELFGGTGLLFTWRPLEQATGWALVLLLIAVCPANIYMATDHIQVNGIPSQPWMAWVRVALQPVLIVGVAWATGIWPIKCRLMAQMKTPRP